MRTSSWSEASPCPPRNSIASSRDLLRSGSPRSEAAVAPASWQRPQCWLKSSSAETSRTTGMGGAGEGARSTSAAKARIAAAASPPKIHAARPSRECAIAVQTMSKRSVWTALLGTPSSGRIRSIAFIIDGGPHT